MEKNVSGVERTVNDRTNASVQINAHVQLDA